MSVRCRVGESMAGDYFDHAAECSECEACESARLRFACEDIIRAEREATWRHAAEVVDYGTGRDLDLLEQAFNEDTAYRRPEPPE